MGKWCNLNRKGVISTKTIMILFVSILIIALGAFTLFFMKKENDFKQKDADDAMQAYVNSVELAVLKQGDKNATGSYQTVNGNIVKDGTTIVVLYGSFKPEDGGHLSLVNGVVKDATLKFNRVTATYDNSANVVPNPPVSKSYEIGNEVYFDPTGSVQNCLSGSEWTKTNTGTTCYKWNVVKVNDNSVELLLNHNIGEKVGWNYRADVNTEQYNREVNGMPTKVYDTLKTATAQWNKAQSFTSQDNVTRKNAQGGTYTLNYDGAKARLISAQEIVNVLKQSSWTDGGNVSISLSGTPWLHQNTYLDASTTTGYYTSGESYNNGYWTDTLVTGYIETQDQRVWVVHNSDNQPSLTNTIIESISGIRPVVRVLKTDIK